MVVEGIVAVGSRLKSCLSAGFVAVLVAGGIALPGSPVLADSYHRSESASPAAKMDAAVTFLGDFDHVSVLEIGGDYARRTADPAGGDTFNAAPRQALAQAFLAQHADAYDFLVVFSGFEFDTGDALAFHAGVQNQVEGIGVPIYDNTSDWGSDGRLQGFLDMAAISRYERNPTRPDFDRVLGTLAHEMMHQWCCFVGLERPGDSAPSDILLGRDAAHWSFLLDSDASVMYGHDWRDNGDGTFDALAIRTFYSPLDLYLAGFNQPSQVAEALLIDNPTVDATALPVQGATLDGTATTFTIDDVIRANGPRVPAAAEAQKRFRLGFVYLVRPDDPIITDDLAFIETVREAFLARFPLMTGGQGVVEIFSEVTADGGSTGSPEPVTGGPLRPDAADVASALAWLRDRQTAEGFWEDRPGTRLRDTQLALEALLRLDPTFAGAEQAVAWLLSQAETSTDYLARLAVALTVAFTGSDGASTIPSVQGEARALRDRIAGRQNGDGGWGVAPGFDSDPLDTALAVLALASHPETDAGTMTAARDFLLATQDASGGWGNGQASPARATVTTTVLRALARLDAPPSPAAITFLAGKQNADDGGFGDSPSSVHDTANVLGTLLALDTLNGLDTGAAIDRLAAEGYLLSRQTVAGSWAGSVYATAVAALALEAAMRPNLLFDSAITFDPVAPQDGEQVIITLGVANDGGVASEATTLELFDGDPVAGGVLIADAVVVPALPTNSRVALTVDWDTTDLGGPHALFARLDPADAVDEGSETDNLVTTEIEVASPPAGIELVLAPGSIAVTPEQPATLPAEVSFFVTIRNVGQTEAVDVVVRAFRGDAAGGVVVFDGLVTVPARGSSLVTFIDSLEDPEASYTVVVDPDDVIGEEDEANNTASVTVTSQPSIDLEVLPNDIVLTATSLVPGADITWDVTVRNRGTRDLPQNATVTYSVTDGSQSVAVLSESVFLTAGQARTRTVTWRADLSSGPTGGLGGDLELVVTIDGGGVLETSVDNNQARSSFSIGTVALPNLVVRFESLGFDPDPAREGKPLTIAARVENTGGTVAADVEVAAYDGNPDTGGPLIAGTLIAGPVTVASLAPGSSELVSLVWQAPPDDQDRFIFVQADPSDAIAEVLEDDNLAFRELVVHSLPDLAIAPASLVLSPAFPRPGDAVTLVVQVANLGEQDTDGVVVRLADGAPGAGGALLAPDQTIAAAGGATVTATFAWTLDAAASGVVIAEAAVDPDATLDERTRANNQATRTFAVQGSDFFTSDRFLSPNGDGVRDAVQFFYRLPEALLARVEVRDRRDQTVRSFSAVMADHGDVVWDGRRDDGRVVRDGTFRFVVLVGEAGSGSATTLGEAAVEVDTNRSPLLRAAGTPFESFVNMTCLLPRVSGQHLTDDEQWLYLSTAEVGDTPFGLGVYRVSTRDLRVREVSVEPGEFTFGVVTAADASKLAFVARNLSATSYDLWVAEGDGSNRTRIGTTTTSSRRFPIGFDAAATFLVYADDRELRRVSVNDPNSSVLLATAERTLFAGSGDYALSPDRRTLLIDLGSEDEIRLHRVDVETGAISALPTEVKVEIARERFSSDGQRLAGRIGSDRVAILGSTGSIVQEISLPAPVYPETLFAEGFQRRAIDSIVWSAIDDQIAFEVTHSDRDPCSGDAVLSVRELVTVDLRNSAIATVAWTELGSFGCSPGGRSLTLPAGEAPGKAASELLFSLGELRWPANDEALYLDGVDFQLQQGWSVFLGERGEPCDPDFGGPCIDDPDNVWRFVRPGIERSNSRFSKSGKLMLFESRRDAQSGSSPCFGLGFQDAFLMRSLANLTADLRLRRSQDSDAVVLEGTAADQNFDSYQLLYASSDAPEIWIPIAPRSNRLVIDDFFQSWLPPGPGTWLVRLNVRDLAGNERDTIRQVASPAFPSIVDVFVEPEIFSPNSDGVRDQAVIHYRTLEPVNLEAQIFDEAGNLAVLLTQSAPDAGVYELPWNGLGLSGDVVPDGRYTIRLAGFELPVRVDTTPVEVDLFVREPYTNSERITPGVSFRPRSSRPEELEIETEALERGIGAFPAIWNAYPFEAEEGNRPRAASVGFAEYTNARFRVRITDRAGNQTVSTSALGVEKLMILAAGDHRLAPDGLNFDVLPPFDSADPNLSAFGTLIEHQAGGVSAAFVVVATRELRFALAETVIAGLGDFMVEVLDESLAWVPFPVSSFVVPGTATLGTLPSEHELGVVWAVPESLPEGALTVRLAARDALGNRFVTSGFEVRVPSTCPPISFQGPLDASLLAELSTVPACVEPTVATDIETMLAENALDFTVDDVLVVLEAVDGQLADPELLLRSAEDPRYGVWQAARRIDARDGVVLFEAVPDFASCTSYDGRATGGVAVTDPVSGVTTTEPVVSEGAFTIPCISLFFAPEVRQAEACGAAPPGILDLYVRAADLTGADDLSLLEVRRRRPIGEDERLFTVANPVSDRSYTFVLDVASWSEGVEELVFHAANGEGATLSVAIRLVVDRTPPVISFNTPAEGAIVCGATDVTGSIEERVPSTELNVLPRFGDRTEASAPGGETRTPPTFEVGLPHVTVEKPGVNAGFTGLQRGAPDRWTFEGSFADIDFVDGPTTVRVAVHDQGGHLACAERSFVIDAFVPRPRVTIADPPAVVGTPTPFSPNGDGARDVVIFDYTIDEPGMAEVVVVEADGGPVVRTLLPEQITSTGGQLVWDGRAENGSVVADGIYGIRVSLRDACGNQEAQGISVEVDTGPPDIEILFPDLSDLDLPAIIDVSMRLAERYTNDLSFGESHDPTAWQAIGSCSVDGAIFTGFCFQRWNTVGLAGDWSLRMRATDTAGNRTTVIEPLRLPVRDDLITFLEPDPELFSPNGDNRREEVAFRFGLVEPADIDLTIETEEGILVAVVASERVESASATRFWNGQMTGNTATGGAPAADDLYIAVLDARLATDPTFQQSERVRFTLDRTPPTITVDRPVDDGFLRGDEAILGEVSDTHLLSWTAFVAPDRAPGSAPPTFTEIGSAVDPETAPGSLGTLDQLEEGAYRLRVIAEDAAEIRSEQETRFTVDNTPPEVAIDQPDEGRMVGAVQGPLEIFGGVSDDHLATWRLEVGLGPAPSEWTTLVAGGAEGPSAPRLIAWDVSAQEDGAYTLRLTAEDRAGNAAEARRGIVIDNTPPTVSLTAPAAGSFVTAPLEVLGTASDLHLVEYRLAVAPLVNGVSGPFSDIGFGVQSVTGGLLASWSALPPDGEYILRLSAFDLPGNMAENAITLGVDTTPPAAPRVLTATIENGRDARLDWNDSTEPDLVGYHVYRAGQRISTTPVPASTFLDVSLPEGEHVYRVTAVDQAGLESEPSNEESVVVDITPPTAVIFAPEDGARVSGLVTVLGTAESQDFREYRLLVSPVGSPAPVIELRRSPVPVVSDELGVWSTLGLADGEPYRVRLEAEDLAGNVGTSEVVVTVDNEAPEPPTVLTATVVGASGPGIDDVRLDWTASDAPDLVGYLLYRDGRLVNASGAAVGSLLPFALDAATFLDRDLADGTYTYGVYAIDQAENLSAPSNEAEAVVETGPPRATIVAPAAGTRFESTVFVEAESTDRDLASVQLQWRLPAGVWNDLGPSLPAPPFGQSFGTVLDPEALALVFGDVEMRAVATDTVGLVDPAPTVTTVTYADLTAPDSPVARVAVDGGEVVVTWDPVDATGLAGYHVYRDFQRITTTLLTDTTLGQSDVADRPFAYHYQVSAVDAEGNESLRSNLAPALVFTPELDQPFTPTPISSPISTSAPDSMLVGRGLRASDTVFGSLLTSAGSTTLAPATTDADGAFVLDVSWALGTNTVTLFLEDAEGNRSRPVSRSLLAGEAPSAPTGLGATVADLDVSLVWNANPEPDLLGYRLVRDGVPVLDDPVVDDFDHLVASSERAPTESAASAVDGDLLTFWRPALVANQWLELGWPDARVVQRIRLDWNEQFGTIAVARDFRVQGLDVEGWVTLAQVVNNDQAINEIVLEQSYRTDRIRLLIDRAFTLVRLAEVTVTTTALFDAATLATVDTPGDGTFTYTLTAWNTLGFESLPSTPAGPLDVGDVVPPDPVVLSAQVVDDVDVALSWTPSPDAVRYDLFRDGVKFAEHTDLTELSLTDAARPNGTYRYTAQAFDAAGNGSALSNEAVVVVAVAPPAAVTLTVVAPPEGAALDLVWQPAAGSSPATYRILRALVSGGPYEEIAMLDGMPLATTLRDSDVTNGVTYFYLVVASDALGNDGAFSNEASGTPENTQPAIAPVLHFPTVPGRLLVTENERETIIGRAGPNDDVILLRDGIEVATARANAETLIEQTEGDLFGPFEASRDGRFAFAPLFIGFGFGFVSDFENEFGVDVAPEPTLARFAADSARFFFLSDAFGLGASELFEQNLETGVSRVVGSAGELHTFAVSPVDDRIMVVGEREGQSGFWLLHSATGDWSLVAASSDIFSIMQGSLRWSPDGSRIAFVRNAASGLLSVLDPLTGSVETLDSATNVNIEPRFSPASERLAFVSSREGVDQIWVHSFGSASSERLADIVSPFDIAWSPAGDAIAYSELDSGHGAVVVRSVSLATGALETLVSSPSLFNSFRWLPSGYLMVSNGGRPERHGLAGRFQLDNVDIPEGRNAFAAEVRGEVSEAIEIQRGDDDGGGGDRAPDLVVSVSAIPAALPTGAAVRITASVENRGTADALATAVSMSVIGAGGFRLDLADEARVPALAVGERFVLGTEDVIDAAPGGYTAVATVDPRNVVVESDESNNTASALITVLDGSAPALSVSTDRQAYDAAETVEISAALVGGVEAFDGVLQLTIEDDAGFVVETLPALPVASLAFAEQRTLQALWPTGGTFAGGYRVRASLVADDSSLAAEGFAAFDIVGASAIESSAVTDAVRYPRGAPVTAIGSFVYASGNQPLAGAVARLTILDDADATFAQWSEPLSLLLPGTQGALTRTWLGSSDSGVLAPAGRYRVRFELLVDGTAQAAAETVFDLVAGASVLLGELTVPATAPEVGEAMLADFSVQEVGGGSLAQVLTRVLVLEAGNLNELARAEQTVDLVAATGTESVVLDTTGFPLGNVLVVLEAAEPAVPPATTSDFVILDRETTQVVDRTPPIVQVLAPTGGFLGVSSRAEVQARDALSAIDTVEVQVDDGPFERALLLADDRYQRLLTGLDEGDHTLRARAADTSANLGTSGEVDFIVDRTPPVIQISGVTAGATVASPAIPIVDIIELHSDTEDVRLDGVPFISGTPVVASGPYVLSVVAVDRAGNRSDAQVSFAVGAFDPDLVAAKTDALLVDADGDGQPSPGDTIRYAVSVSNVGDGAASAVIFRDSVAPETQVVPGSVTSDLGSVVSEAPIEVDLGTLAPATVATISFDVSIVNPLPAGVTEIANQGTVLSAELPAVLTDDPGVSGTADATVTAVFVTPQMTISDASVIEGGPGDAVEAILTVTLDRVSNRPVAVSFASADSTAVAGDDYTAVAGVLEVPVGELTGTIVVPILGDVLDEADEMFAVVLDNAVGATIADNAGADGEGIVTIVDDDEPVADATLAGLVWFDENRDGVVDGNEPALAGVGVNLLDASGMVVETAATSVTGGYRFETLTAGTYTVAIDSATLPAGVDDPTFDIDGIGTPGEATITLGAGEARTQVDFGYADFACPPELDFERDAAGQPLTAGTLAAEQWAAFGIHITTDDPVPHPAMLFDSATPTGGDDDLGSPNGDFGGPGVGAGGGEGQAGVNFEAEGLVLIVSEDGDSTDPDDLASGTLIFDFDEAVDVAAVRMVDASAGTITALDSTGLTIVRVEIANLGENGAQRIPVDAISVSRLEIVLRSSGGVAGIVFCGPCTTLGFERDAVGDPLLSGTILDDELAPWGITFTTHDPVAHPPMIFDTTTPTGGDFDLGTPNKAFYGPGIGTGGGADRRTANAWSQGKVLIISEDGDTSDPDDNARGGTLVATFDHDVRIESITTLDVRGGRVAVFDAAGDLITVVPIPDRGQNALQVVPVAANGVRRMELSYPSSGALAGIEICAERPRLEGDVLFVAGSRHLSLADAWICSRLEGLGLVVTVVDDNVVETADGVGRSLIVVSSTVSSGKVASAFRDLAVPVVSWEAWLYDDLGMTGTVSGTDFGNRANQTVVEVVDGSVLDVRDLETAGVDGLVAWTDTAARVAWGQPSAEAWVVAVLAVNDNKAGLFGYEAGAGMPGLVAPARRVALPLHNGSATVLTATGWRLFEAAIRWALGSRELALEKRASLVTDVDGNGVASPRDTLRYTLTLGNDGEQPRGGLVVREVLPAAVSLVEGSVTVTVGANSQGTLVGTAPLEVAFDPLAAGETATIMLDVVLASDWPLAVASIINQASVEGPDMAVVLSDDPTTIELGDATEIAVFVPVQVAVGDASLVEGNVPAGGEMLFTVALDAPTNRPLTVGYETLAGSAEAGVDFVAVAGSVTLPAGASTASIAVPLIGDRLDEGDEILRLRISLPVALPWVSLTREEAVGTILDDDQGVVLTCLPDLDFEVNGAGQTLVAGQLIEDAWASLGITVTTDDPVNHPAMIFDSAAPTGGDTDLGAPNQAFWGPGVGAGGGIGQAGENPWSLGKILILSEDGDATDPDDNAQGGTLIFDFASPVELADLSLLDAGGGSIQAFDVDGGLIASAAITNLGNNGLQRIEIQASGVSRLEIALDGSGALSSLRFCPLAPPASGSALLVAGAPTLGAADTLMRRRLEGLGYSVDVVDDDGVASVDAEGRAVVAISSTVSSGKVEAAFRDVAVPVATWEAYLYDDLGMAGPSAGSDYGNRGGQSSLNVVDGAALGITLSGEIPFSDSGPYSWARPGPSAWVSAVLVPNHTKAAIFGYEADVIMPSTSIPGLSAPARRLGLALGNDTALSLTESAWQLVDAALLWLGGAP